MRTSTWRKLVRFRAYDGSVQYGEPSADLKTVTVWEGKDIFTLCATSKTAEVAELLAPYQPTTIIGIGVNYKGHAQETGHILPTYPVIFRKLPNSITGPCTPIELHGGDVDYENELAVIVGKDAKDVPAIEALDYILGFTVANDVSSRMWQRPATAGGQACYAKSFDGFCPLGPGVVAPSALQNYQNLQITTRRDGRVVQSSNTNDMVFHVPELLSFLTRGTTLPAGTLILTGTPPGVGTYANPPNFIKPGETIECEIEGIGVIKNRFVPSMSKFTLS